jgi:hypothetical protein
MLLKDLSASSGLAQGKIFSGRMKSRAFDFLNSVFPEVLLQRLK